MLAYSAPWWLPGGHLQTIWPVYQQLDSPSGMPFHLELADGDFVNGDLYSHGNRALVLLLHGLEGSSRSFYMLQAANHFLNQGFDVLCLNFRSCGPEMNRGPLLYHSGFYGDVEQVVETLALSYSSLFAIGFSLGGAVLLNWLQKGHVHSKLIAAMAVSAPCHLESCSRKLESPMNFFYQRQFVRSLVKKASTKALQFPQMAGKSKLKNISTVYHFDDVVTAPMFGFRSAADYYEKCSTYAGMNVLQRPTLLLQAKNDPFLTPFCFPAETGMLKTHYQNSGGHVGFPLANRDAFVAQRAFDFFSSVSA